MSSLSMKLYYKRQFMEAIKLLRDIKEDCPCGVQEIIQEFIDGYHPEDLGEDEAPKEWYE